MIVCAYCNSRVLDGDRKCQACGSAVFIDETVLPRRPKEAEKEKPNEAIQPVLLEEAALSREQFSGRNRWVALCLCVFMGALGTHRFYTGKIGTGLLFLCSFGFFGFGIAVDALTILFGFFRDREGLRLK